MLSRLISCCVALAIALLLPVALADGAARTALRSSWSRALITGRLPVRPAAIFGSHDLSLQVAPVGSAPVFAAENHKTNTLYVTNSNDNTVSVVNLAECSTLNASGCLRTSPVVRVGSLPLGVAVDEATNTIYVANALDGTVSVLNGATCNGGDSAGCGQKPATISVGKFGDAVAVDTVTNTVFVTNQDASPGTVSVIDGNSCNGAHPSGCATQPLTAVAVGGGPSGIDINPRTNSVYVANTGQDSNNHRVPDGNTVSVINGATCNATNTAGCVPVGTVRVGVAPAAVAVDPATNSVYVANTHDGTVHEGTVSVINGSTCEGSDPSGCASQHPPEVTVGADPIGVAVDSNNRSIYVTNPLDDTVSVIDGSGCNGMRPSGCKLRPPTIALGGAPSWAVVDTARHTVYVPDQVDNNVAVLKDLSCSGNAASGCRHAAPTVPAGSFPNAAANDERYHTVYVGDANGFQPPYTVSMTDAATCNIADRSGCNRPPHTLPAERPPSSITVNQRTNTVYVASSGPLQVIDAATCNATTRAGCRHTAAVPAGGYVAAVNASTDTIYAANSLADGSGYLSVIDGRHCNAADTSRCASQTTGATATVAVGHNPGGVAVDPATHTVYVTSVTDHTVSVIDTTHCHAGDTSQCATQSPPTIAIPNASGPIAIAVDQATRTAYVSDAAFPFSSGALSLIDTTHCHAGDTSRCASQAPGTIPMPAGPGSSIQIDPDTNAVYIANLNDSTVSVIDGRHCNAMDMSRCSRIPKLEVGSNPSDLTLDQSNGTVYVPNYYDNNASVFGISGSREQHDRAAFRPHFRGEHRSSARATAQ